MLYGIVNVHFFLLLFFFFFLFPPPLLSGPYLWNCYSQRLQIQCAAWSCGLVLHYCLPTNSLCYFFFSRIEFATILSGPYIWNCYSQRLQIECAAWSFGLILHYYLPSNPRRDAIWDCTHSFFFLSYFFRQILSGQYLWNCYSQRLQRLQIECAAWSCSLILHCCLPSNSLHYFFFYIFSLFPPRFCPGHTS